MDYNHALLYQLYLDLRARCENPDAPDYKYYGARGISVCDRWRTHFDLFIADMGYPVAPGTTLTRTDSDGNYEPANCRWQQHIKSSFAPELEQPPESKIDAWLAKLSQDHKQRK